ncbi:MAG TPA: (d)CMP kinase [Candidatus Limnocylindrales bacterium]|nr:(d)CMP kinase [Candidatus Limnocylindrales bacterium]
MAENKGFVIAIDGPVASGKGALAAQLAKKLKGFYLYTGAMYRSVAFLCIEKGIDLENESDVESVLSDLNIELENDRVILNGQDVTERLNEPDTASGSSVVGVYPNVRQVAVLKQQEIGEKAIKNGKIVVAEGRDIGTVVFPNAAAKIYLTARPEIRAKRRMEQFITQKKDLTKELQNLKTRDKRDTEREVGPLPSDPENLGYFILDNSDLTEDQTMEKVLGELKKRNLII